MRRAAAAASILLASLGCAGVPRGQGAVAWTFPARYEANQIVTVDSGDTRREFLASVRRSRGDVEVTLFDPALAAPLIAGRMREGAAEETRYAAGIPPGYGVQLVRMLADLHGARFPIGADGAGEAGGVGVRYRVRSLSADYRCRFPEVIEVTPRARGPRIHVATIDVACGAEGD